MLRSRDLQTDIQTLPDTLSSWDKCMAKDFCKYPVIVGCIIGGLIFISLIWCVIRCLMCGYACCSCCCGGCGGSQRSQKHKHQVEFVPVQPPPIYQPPVYHQEQPQYAYTTDRSGKVSGDSLPAMPTWESTKVEVKEEVEMGYVNNEGYKRKTPSPSHGGYVASPPMVALQQRGLTPAPKEIDAYAQRQHSHTPSHTPSHNQRVLSPGPMPAPIPINPTGQKMGFNPCGPTPGPQRQFEYEDRDPIQDNSGYQNPQQQGPRWGNQPPHQRQPYDLQYDNDAPEVVLPPQLQPGHCGQQYGGGGNPDYYNAYSPSEVVPPQQGGAGGYAAYQAPRAHGHPPQNGQSMYPVDDKVYDYDDPHRRKQDPWSAL
ncbi:hypothetical protein EV426DRAFT_573648 [Tirmania nivea]|nr:hypothetical protein EV426DRAFT_573648 [Tirmania nivea]